MESQLLRSEKSIHLTIKEKYDMLIISSQKDIRAITDHNKDLETSLQSSQKRIDDLLSEVMALEEKRHVELEKEAIARMELTQTLSTLEKSNREASSTITVMKNEVSMWFCRIEF